MSRVAASAAVRASLAEVWDFYFDPAGWPAWVDGFARVDSDMGYPEAGGTLRWSSTPAGRGTVTERGPNCSTGTSGSALIGAGPAASSASRRPSRHTCAKQSPPIPVDIGSALITAS